MRTSKILLTIVFMLISFKHSTIASDESDHFKKVDKAILCKIAGFLPIHDLTNLEEVSKEFSEFLADSYQYTSLINDWPKGTGSTAKENFLRLKNTTPEYQVYLADLWRNNFPFLTNDDYLGNGLPLTFYWGNFLTGNIKEKIYFIYGLYSTNFVPIDPQYSDKAILGKFKMTMSQGADQAFGTLLNKPNCLASTQAEAQLCSSLMGYSRPNPHYGNVRTGLNAVIMNNNANPWNKSTAQLKRAVMDRLGQGIPVVDPIKAREGLIAVIHNPVALPEDKASARVTLAQMMRVGEGENPDAVGAYNLYDDVMEDNAASPHNRATARLATAQMMRVGEGVVLNSVGARGLFNAVRADNAASPQQKISAALALAQMDRFGEGAITNPASACNTFIAVMQDNAALPQDKASAQLALAQMMRVGENGTHFDPGTAFNFFDSVMQNNAALPQDKASAQLALAQIMRVGENGAPFNTVTAYNFFMAVEQNNAALPQDRASAQLALAQMMWVGEGGTPFDARTAYNYFITVEQNNAALLQDRTMARVALTQIINLEERITLDLFYARNLFITVMEDNAIIDGIRTMAKLKFSQLNYWGEGIQNPICDVARNLVLSKCSLDDRKILSQVSKGFYQMIYPTHKAEFEDLTQKNRICAQEISDVYTQRRDNVISFDQQEEIILPLYEKQHSLLKRLISFPVQSIVSLDKYIVQKYCQVCNTLGKYEDSYQGFMELENRFQVTLENMPYPLFQDYFTTLTHYPSHLQNGEYDQKLQNLEAFLYNQKEPFEPTQDTSNGYTFLARLYKHEKEPEKLVALYKNHNEFIPLYRNMNGYKYFREEPYDIFYACLEAEEFDLADELVSKTDDMDDFAPLDRLLPSIGRGNLEGFQGYLKDLEQTPSFDDQPSEQLNPSLIKAAACLAEKNVDGVYQILQDEYQQPDCNPLVPILLTYWHSKFGGTEDHIQHLKEQVKVTSGAPYEEMLKTHDIPFLILDLLTKHIS